MSIRLLTSLLVGVLMIACGDDDRPGGDAGTTVDGGEVVDSGTTTEGGTTDGGTGTDTGTTDGDIGTDAGLVDPRTSLSGPLGVGGRIQTEVITTGGGPETVVGYYDSLRDERCRFLTASDGVIRCLPTDIESSSGLTYFADDACTQPVYLVSSRYTCPVGGLLRVRDTATCPERNAIHPIGSELASGATVYLLDDMGACVTGSTTSRPFMVEAEIAPAEYASASIMELVRTADLVIEALETEDGTVAYHRTRLAEGSTCAPWPGTDDVVRCLPNEASMGAAYADSSCSTVLAGYASSVCDVPGFAFERGTATGCEDLPRTIYQTTGAFGGTAYRRTSPTTCIEGSFSPNLATVSDVVAPTTFPATPEEMGPGTRLVERRYAIVDGYGYRISLYDTVLATDCAFGLASDGELRCIPVNGPGTRLSGAYFVDRSCRIPLVSDARGCPSPFVSTSESADGCSPPLSTVYRRGDRYTGGIYYRAGICTLATRPSEFGLTFYRQGATIEPVDMVLGTLERR